MSGPFGGVPSRLEEELALHETTLQCLSKKKELLALQVEMKRSKLHARDVQMQSLQERKQHLKRERETHLKLHLDVRETLDKCQERLSSIAPNMQLLRPNIESEPQGIKSSEAEVMSPKSPPNSPTEKEPETFDLSGDQLHGLRSSIPLLHCSRPILDDFWSSSGKNGVMSFLPCLNSSTLIRKVLDVNALETLALDIARPRSSTHRKESLRNTSLDVFSCMCPSEETMQVSKEHSSALKEQTSVCKEGGAVVNGANKNIDPNVALCPYELGGVCADVYCPYQHLQERTTGLSPTTMVARERLPLPPLRIEAPFSSLKPVATAVIEHDSEKQRCTNDVSTSSETTGMKPPEQVSKDASTIQVVVDEMNDESKHGSVDWQDTLDFVPLPQAPAIQADPGDMVFATSVFGRTSDYDSDYSVRSSMEEGAAVPTFWWMNDEDSDRVQRYRANAIEFSTTSLGEWLYLWGGFRFANGDIEQLCPVNAGEAKTNKRRRTSTRARERVLYYDQQPPEKLSDVISFLGRVIDCMRVVIHAGRFDLAYSLHKISQQVVDGTVKRRSQELAASFRESSASGTGKPWVEDEPILPVLQKMTKNVADATKSLLCYNTDPLGLGVFHNAFYMNIALAILSDYVGLLSTHGSNDLGDDSWSDLLDEWSTTVFGLDEIDHQPRCHDLSDFVRKSEHELFGVSGSYPVGTTGEPTNKRVVSREISSYRALLFNLRRGMAFLASLDENGETEAMPIESLSSDVKGFMRRSADFSSSPDPLVGATILGYVVLSAVKVVVKDVMRSTGDYMDSHGSATISELDTFVDQTTAFLERQVQLHDRTPSKLGSLVVSPLRALSASLCASLGLYGKTQLRLEMALSSHTPNKNMAGPGRQKNTSLTEFSNLLWSQLVQLRACLPFLPTTNGLDCALPLSSLPSEISTVHALLADRILDKGVNLNHIILQGDRNLMLSLYGEQKKISALASNVHENCYSLISSIFSPHDASAADAGNVSLEDDQVVLGAENGVVTRGIAIDLSNIPFTSHPGRNLSASLEGAAVPRSILLGGDAIETLSLKRCRLTELPTVFGSCLRHLQELDISENNLSELPASIGEIRSLRCLYASKNRLTRLPRAIVRCKRLEVLDLRWNMLESLPTPELPLKLPKLKTLLLDHDDSPDA